MSNPNPNLLTLVRRQNQVFALNQMKGGLEEELNVLHADQLATHLNHARFASALETAERELETLRADKARDYEGLLGLEKETVALRGQVSSQSTLEMSLKAERDNLRRQIRLLEEQLVLQDSNTVGILQKESAYDNRMNSEGPSIANQESKESSILQEALSKRGRAIEGPASTEPGESMRVRNEEVELQDALERQRLLEKQLNHQPSPLPPLPPPLEPERLLDNWSNHRRAENVATRAMHEVHGSIQDKRGNRFEPASANMASVNMASVNMANAFSRMDANGDGVIDRFEFERAQGGVSGMIRPPESGMIRPPESGMIRPPEPLTNGGVRPNPLEAMRLERAAAFNALDREVSSIDANPNPNSNPNPNPNPDVR